MSTWVKVCGLRTVEDVEVAVESGADAVGLMLAGSPRRISIDQATDLARVAETVDSVLVIADLDVRQTQEAVERTGASGIQPYGAHAGSVARWAIEQGLLVLQPIAVGTESIGDVRVETGAIPLLDTASPFSRGGGGRTFDWNLTRDYPIPFVLAGGLNPENIHRAVRETEAWGVDASSGLESSLGTKDHQKIRAFIEGAKHP